MSPAGHIAPTPAPWPSDDPSSRRQTSESPPAPPPRARKLPRASAVGPDARARGSRVLVASLWRFWLLRGHTSEGSDWVERALVAAPEPALARARALVGLTCLDSRRGRSDCLRAQAAEAVSIATRAGRAHRCALPPGPRHAGLVHARGHARPSTWPWTWVPERATSTGATCLREASGCGPCVPSPERRGGSRQACCRSASTSSRRPTASTHRSCPW